MVIKPFSLSELDLPCTCFCFERETPIHCVPCGTVHVYYQKLEQQTNIQGPSYSENMVIQFPLGHGDKVSRTAKHKQ